MDHYDSDNLNAFEIKTSANMVCDKEKRLIDLSEEGIVGNVNKIPDSKDHFIEFIDNDFISSSHVDLSGLESHKLEEPGNEVGEALRVVSPTGCNKIVLQRASGDTNDEDTADPKPGDLSIHKTLLSDFTVSHHFTHNSVVRCRSAGLQSRPSTIVNVIKNKSVECHPLATDYIKKELNPVLLPRRPKLGIIRGLSRQKKTDSGDEDPSTFPQSPWRVSFNMTSEKL